MQSWKLIMVSLKCQWFPLVRSCPVSTIIQVADLAISLNKWQISRMTPVHFRLNKSLHIFMRKDNYNSLKVTSNSHNHKCLTFDQTGPKSSARGNAFFHSITLSRIFSITVKLMLVSAKRCKLGGVRLFGSPSQCNTGLYGLTLWSCWCVRAPTGQFLWRFLSTVYR